MIYNDTDNVFFQFLPFTVSPKGKEFNCRLCFYFVKIVIEIKMEILQLSWKSNNLKCTISFLYTMLPLSVTIFGTLCEPCITMISDCPSLMLVNVLVHFWDTVCAPHISDIFTNRQRFVSVHRKKR